MTHVTSMPFPRQLVASFAVLAALAACASAPGSEPSTASGSQAPPGQVSTPIAPSPSAEGASLDPEIAHAIDQRRQFGLRSDLEWVLKVAADPRATMDPLDFLMLPEEAAELQERQTTLEGMAQAVQKYGDAHPSEFGGVWIDQERRTVVSVWTANPALHRVAILTGIGKAGPLDVRLVLYSEAELRELQDRMTEARDWLATIPAAMTFSSVDVMTNRAELGISSANPQAAALIQAHFGVPPDKLRVTSDGTGILLKPRGTVHGRVVNEGGDAPGRNDWMLNWSSDGPTGGDCGEMVGYGVKPDGTFELPCAPGGWTISVDAPVADGWAPIGSAHLVVPAGGDVDLTIAVDPARAAGSPAP
jgi:hypothetical protein